MSAVASGPAWLRAVLRAERTVGGPLTRVSNSQEAADVMLVLARGARFGLEATERVRGAVVHALDLPSHRDLQLLDAKVERLQRALDDLAAEREEAP